jgi:hypothetical protein
MTIFSRSINSSSSLALGRLKPLSLVPNIKDFRSDLIDSILPASSLEEISDNLESVYMSS